MTVEYDSLTDQSQQDKGCDKGEQDRGKTSIHSKKTSLVENMNNHQCEEDDHTGIVCTMATLSSPGMCR